MRSVRVLYDGWPLVYEPYGPAAMHLQALLAHLPTEVEAVVALPGPAPGWLQNTHSLRPLGFSQTLRVLIQPIPGSDTGQLLWEQRLLPRIERQIEAQILHLPSPVAPLFGKAIRVVSPGAFEGLEPALGLKFEPARRSSRENRSLAARLHLSLGQGGLARARAIFWPEDAPTPDLPVPVVKLPPVVHPSFSTALEEPVLPEATARGSNGHPRLEIESLASPGMEQQARMLAAFDLPETYVLYHGPSSPYWLQRLLESWQWASGPIGDQYPLLVLGLSEERREAFVGMVRQFKLGDTVRALPDIPIEALSAVYRGCAVFFHPAPFSPWGGPVRNALACGKPVVAAESRLADAIVGPAAYLAPAEDTRALGAALLTVIVEEEVAGALAQNARQRSNTWRSPAFGQALLEAYQQLL